VTIISHSSCNGHSNWKKKIVLFSLPQNDISREMLVCVFWFFFLAFFDAAVIRKHMATIMTPQASSVSLNVFIVLRQ
jgi:hypothetical protein